MIEVTKHFKVKPAMVINKHDLNCEVTKRIEEYCQKKDIPLLGKVSFDKAVVEAMVEGKTIIEYQDSLAKEEVKRICNLRGIYERSKKTCIS